jgi:hypothetical protein
MATDTTPAARIGLRALAVAYAGLSGLLAFWNVNLFADVLGYRTDGRAGTLWVVALLALVGAPTLLAFGAAICAALRAVFTLDRRSLFASAMLLVGGSILAFVFFVAAFGAGSPD